MEKQEHADTGELLSHIGGFTSADAVLFERQTRVISLNKGEELLSKGQVCQAVFLVISGAAYHSEYDQDIMEDNILGLYTIGDWCFDHASFVAQKPSRSAIKAYSDMQVREISVHTIHQLIAISPAFYQFGGLLQKGVERLRYLENAKSAVDKYELLLCSRPELFQAFPLKMIASYLKIAPETLSRIRAKK